jgi:hypothetical protein
MESREVERGAAEGEERVQNRVSRELERRGAGRRVQ